ncbi:MAG: NAD(P)-binding domain-containing protein [Burkholderiales bacterium]|nr:NAD(P)-binding domain-containing protein [Burkholderiales bacterium]
MKAITTPKLPDLSSKLPVAIIGAGPVGLAAAAHLLSRDLRPLILEAGPSVASHLESYRHVRLFSPWRYNVDAQARTLLERAGWRAPDPDVLPAAGEVIDQYLAPLANIRVVAEALRYNTRVLSIARKGFDKVKTAGRDAATFTLRVRTPNGDADLEAWAVIDASGTWGTPNPLGANGLPARGEKKLAHRIAYGMPDVLGHQRSRYAGKRVLVAGAGHSAAGTLIQLSTLAEQVPQTQLVWTIRGHNFQRIFGGGANDGLPARGALGERLRVLRDAGRLELHADFKVSELTMDKLGITVAGERTDGSAHSIEGIDEIIVCAGGRPDHSLSSELRVKLDPWLESTEQLAPLIDPNVHSCGTVRPHGHRELQHPESRFYAVGAKSYGRAPNFLLATGHEQVRSVVAALAGDFKAADEVHLELPQTGVCSSQFVEGEDTGCCTVGNSADETAQVADGCGTGSCGTPSRLPAIPAWQGDLLKVASTAKPTVASAPASCCGGPPLKRADACCVTDEVAKDAGDAGCGCSAEPLAPKLPKQAEQRKTTCCA